MHNAIAAVLCAVMTGIAAVIVYWCAADVLAYLKRDARNSCEDLAYVAAALALVGAITVAALGAVIFSVLGVP